MLLAHPFPRWLMGMLEARRSLLLPGAHSVGSPSPVAGGADVGQGSPEALEGLARRSLDAGAGKSVVRLQGEKPGVARGGKPPKKNSVVNLTSLERDVLVPIWQGLPDEDALDVDVSEIRDGLGDEVDHLCVAAAERIGGIP